MATELSDEELLSALGVEAASVRTSDFSSLEERVIAGFQEILLFADREGRPPFHGEGRPILERLYAVRLDRLRMLPEFHDLLAPLDVYGLLSAEPSVAPAAVVDQLDDDEILAALGVSPGDASDITKLTHVRSYEERQAAEEIANRTLCEDFERFQPLFERVEAELRSGVRQTIPFARDASVAEGNLFILGGQTVLVAEVRETFRTPNHDQDARLRVIYSNGTESNLLQRSLQRALYKDDTARRVTDPTLGPLFGDSIEPDDLASGSLYVLRSQSEDPFIAANRGLIHKIGITGGDVHRRVAVAPKDATYLLADVDIVAVYQLANVNRTRLENLFHRIFQRARLDITIKDRFGSPVQPREWFLVPLEAIDEAVHRLQDGSITDYVYDAEQASLVRRAS